MSAPASSALDTTKGWFSNYGPSALVIGGALLLLVNMIMLGMNVGTQDTNQDIRKWVGISIVPITIGLVLLWFGMNLYYTRFPTDMPKAALILSLAAVAIACMGVSISLIDKTYS